MGTHPIFESDFDCLTAIEIVCTMSQNRQLNDSDLIHVPNYPPDPIEGGLHAWRMGASMVSNPFRNVDDESTLSVLSQRLYRDDRLLRLNRNWNRHIWFMCVIICTRFATPRGGPIHPAYMETEDDFPREDLHDETLNSK